MGNDQEISGNLLKAIESLAGDMAVVKKIATYESEKIQADVADLKRIVIEGNGEDSHRHKLRDHEKRIGGLEGRNATAEKELQERINQRQSQRRTAIYGAVATLMVALIISVAGVVWVDHKAAQSIAASKVETPAPRLNQDDVEKIVDAILGDSRASEPKSATRPKKARRETPAPVPPGINRLEAGYKKKDNLAELRMWADLPVNPIEPDRR